MCMVQREPPKRGPQALGWHGEERIVVLHGKDVGVEIGDPLLPGLRDVEMPQTVFDIPIHDVPVEQGIIIA